MSRYWFTRGIHDFRSGARAIEAGLQRLRLAVIAASCAFAAVAVPQVAQAQSTLKPLDAVHDPNGVNLLNGQIQTRMPELSVPASSNLKMSNIQDFLPFLTGNLQSGAPVPSSYDINDGSLTSEHFDCKDDECKSTKKAGGTLIPSPSSKEFEYYQGGTATHIHFDLQNFYQSQIVGVIGFSFYASYIAYASGETISISYDEFTASDGRVFRRPSTLSSNLGYQINLDYQAVYPAIGWSEVANAKLYKSTDLTHPLASYAYASGAPATNTITDIAGRQFVCFGCSNGLGGSSSTSVMNLRLPTESTDSVVVTGSPCGNYITSVAIDGVTYNYAITPTATDCKYLP